MKHGGGNMGSRKHGKSGRVPISPRFRLLRELELRQEEEEQAQAKAKPDMVDAGDLQSLFRRR